MDETIVQVIDVKLQRAETYRNWQSLSPGERLNAVWELSAELYGYKEPPADQPRAERMFIRRRKLSEMSDDW